MSEDKVYKDGDIVWVKLGNNWWPGEVTGPTRHPEGLVKHLKRAPYCVVKFFNENTYEYVRSGKQIFPFQCSKQDDFIRKGFSLYNNGNSFMEKFPADVKVAKQLVQRKEASLIINDRPDSIVKAILGQPLIRTHDEHCEGTENREKRYSGDSVTKILNITSNRNNDSLNRQQPQAQTCDFCDFTSVRLNVMILHRKIHSNKNSVGPGNSTNNSTLKPISAKSIPGAAATPITNINVNTNNKKVQNQDDVNSKTKISTISTTKAATPKTPSTPPRLAPVNKTNALYSANEIDKTAEIASKEKNNGKIKFATSKNKSKVAKKSTTVQEKNKDNAYAAILSDFCPSEPEASPPPEERQSRRSLRHCKTNTEIATEKVATACIDLSDSKTIQKIPKKREYSTLHLENESLLPMISSVEPDVQCLSEKEKETIGLSTVQSDTTKKDAEDIRRMLLADWSDDDESPVDTIVMHESTEQENVKSHEHLAPDEGPQNSAAVVATSTPIIKSSSATTGRIRNIPKKDRRDVVLQDFNSDLSFVQKDNTDLIANKTMAVDLESSNSSVVEIIEEQHPATIITINDDEDQDKSQLEKNQEDVIVTEGKANDSSVYLTSDKSASAATSTSTLSCFDFKDDEDEQDNAATTISHFKKKYLSGEKLQNTPSTATDDLKENNVTKSRAELAEKDQRLAADIDSLLEQTQPTVVDLLNASSFEESLSVKDLPIKERGKRIFKSRNKTRLAHKVNTDLVTPVEVSLTEDSQTKEENTKTTEVSGTMIKDQHITVKNVEVTTNKDDLINKKCLVEISSQQILFSTQAVIPNCLEDKKSTPNDDQNNETSNEGYKVCSEMSIDDNNTNQNQEIFDETMITTSDITNENIDCKEQTENNIEMQHENNIINNNLSEQSTPNDDQNNETSNKGQKECSEISIDYNNTYQTLEILNETIITTSEITNETIITTSEITNENINVEEQIEKTIEMQHENSIINDNLSKQLRDVQQVAESQQEPRDNREQDNTPAVAETQLPEPQDTITENDEEIREIFPNEENPMEKVSDLDDNKSGDAFRAHLCTLNKVEVKDKPAVTVLKVQILKHSGDLQEDFTKHIIVEKSSSEIIVESDEEVSKSLVNGTSDSKTKNQTKCESVFKIRVKSPEQLLDQAFVMASQQDQDTGVDARLISTTPTDENSSMGTSDTGAEFGSPTSMLSEERLPAFRFQSNQTPQLEVETVEAIDTQIDKKPGIVQDISNEDSGKNRTADIMKEPFLKDKYQIYQIREQKSLQQRRFSMDFIFKTEPKSLKRQRLSVDDVATNQGNSFDNTTSEKFLANHQKKIEINVHRKSRHVKITPRRNVNELFKEENKKVRSDAPKCSSLEKVKKTLPFEGVGNTIVEKEQVTNSEDVVQVTENFNTKLDKAPKTNTQNKENFEESSDNNALSKTTENKGLESPTEHEVFQNLVTEIQDKKLICSEKETINKEELNSLAEIQDEPNVVSGEVIKDLKKLEEAAINTEESRQINLKSSLDEITSPDKESNESNDVVDKSILDDNITQDSNHAENVDDNSLGTPVIANETDDNAKTSKSTSIETLSLENNKMQKAQVLENPFSPEIPPITPQEREVVTESEIPNQLLETQQEIIEHLPDKSIFSLTAREGEKSPEISNQDNATQEKENLLHETGENEHSREEIVRPSMSLEEQPIIDSSDLIATSAKVKDINECETLVEPATPQQPLDMVIEFDSSLPMPSTPRECENIMHISSNSPAKDLINECEPSTPQGHIECDHSLPAQITPEKEEIIESNLIPDLPAQITPEKEVIIESDVILDKPEDIIVERNIRLEDKEILLEKEFQVIEPKESYVPIDIPQESHTNSMQTDADKAAEEFLIEFDSIVNHNHTVEQGVQKCTVEDDMNAEDLISNIIEEVHEDTQPKDDVTKSEPPIQFEPMMTYTVVANKNWNQIFKDSFKTRQSINPAKRRQTICFEISDTKEGVACKKQAFDFESILPVNKTIKRTAERKLTLPAMETNLSNSNQSHNILSLNTNQITLNKKLIPAKRKLSIEDNITSFIIERPKQPQQSSNVVSGPPPLQRIRPLRRQSHIIAKTSLDSMSEPPTPHQSSDNLYTDLFPAESSSSKQDMESDHKFEEGRVLHQQIISGPTPAISAIHQNKPIDSKISTNKQIGVDSRGNKYVIIKTPPTDIVVQPTLTSTTAAAAPATNNFGTTITFQPLARSSSEISTTKPTTKHKNISKQQLQQQQMKQISITVPANSTVEVSNSTESSAKTALRNRRKAAQAKTVAAASSAANNNMNSAKHRQAMEALSRRLSIASEAPPLTKISRTASTNVQTQISNNSNLSTLFGDAQISNIAQQQLIQLQQQQQSIQTTSSPLPPPIILNKSAHQQSVIQRKARKFPSQHQTQLQHQQTMAAKTSQLVQQQNSVLQQSQQLQQQIIAQIALQQQTQHQHNTLQPPPLQQIQQQTAPMQQQIVQQSDGVIITTAATEDDDVIDSNTQLIALPTQPYPGYAETFLLCKVKGNTCKPVDNVPLYLNQQLNELVPVPLEAIESCQKTQKHQIEIKPSNATQQLLSSQTNEPDDNAGNMQIGNIDCNLADDEISAGIESEHQIQNSQQHQIMEESVVDENGASGSNNQISDFAANEELNTDLVSNNGILLNIEGQQVLLDAATFAHLLANPDANTQLISDDGTEYVLTHEVLQALQIQQEQQQALELANAAAEQQEQLERTAASNDIIAVALAGSDLYDNDVLTIDTSQGMQLLDGSGSIVFPAQTGSITQQHLTPPSVVTNAVLDQSPIMSTLEVPSSLTTTHKLQGTQLITVPSHHLATSTNAALGLGGRPNLEDSLAAIGVTTQSSSIPTSLGLPITVTNPNIASKVTSAGPLNEMLHFVSHRPATAAATAAAVAAAALAGESRIFTD